MGIYRGVHCRRHIHKSESLTLALRETHLFSLFLSFILKKKERERNIRSLCTLIAAAAALLAHF